jgi:hypothetical protein
MDNLKHETSNRFLSLYLLEPNNQLITENLVYLTGRSCVKAACEGGEKGEEW